MTYSSTSTITNIAEMIFIGGNTVYMEFDVIDAETGSAQDLGSNTILWSLCPFGQYTNVVLTKAGVIDGVIASRFSVTLESVDTEDFKGKYFHQSIIEDITGEKAIAYQGIITILPLIQ